ncbi:hypothetical protein CBM2621_B140143 [Cupriavidus taiwanensis]|nr:hypothetical protein CBM2621_B140143 [Cupriavidus taiwanensis]
MRDLPGQLAAGQFDRRGKARAVGAAAAQHAQVILVGIGQLDRLSHLAQRLVGQPDPVAFMLAVCRRVAQRAFGLRGEIANPRRAPRHLERWQRLAQVQAQDLLEQRELQRVGQQELAVVADAAVVDLDQARAVRGQDVFGMAGAETDAEAADGVQHFGFDRGGQAGAPYRFQLNEVRRRRQGHAEAAQRAQRLAIAQRFERIQRALQVFFQQQCLTRVPGPDRAAMLGQLGAAARQADLLAGHAFARLDDARHRHIGKRGQAGAVANHCVPERVDARLCQASPHLCLVLGGVGGAPVLARQAKVRRCDGSGRLQVIAVGKHGRGLAAAAGEGVDHRQRVEDIARDDVLRVGGQAGAGKVGAMGIGTIRQQDDGAPERARRRQEAVVDGGGRYVSEYENLLHESGLGSMCGEAQ